MTAETLRRLRFHPERRKQWSCALCAALVAEAGMVRHARFHGDQGHLDGQRPDCTHTSEWTAREVVFSDQLVEVNRA